MGSTVVDRIPAGRGTFGVARGSLQPLPRDANLVVGGGDPVVPALSRIARRAHLLPLRIRVTGVGATGSVIGYSVFGVQGRGGHREPKRCRPRNRQ